MFWECGNSVLGTGLSYKLLFSYVWAILFIISYSCPPSAAMFWGLLLFFDISVCMEASLLILGKGLC